MKRLALVFAATMLPIAPAALAQDGATPEQLAANNAAKSMSERLYWLDQAALNASAALTASVNLAEHPDVRGYVTEELDEGKIAVIYYAVTDDRYLAFARYEVEKSTVISGAIHDNPSDHPLSEALLRMAKARDAALAQGAKESLQLCMTTGANFITLPPDSDDRIAVYILSAPTTPGRYPIGGHYMFEVNGENAVVAGRAFADRCLDVPVIHASVTNPPDNYTMSHMSDPQPNALHHFVARQMNLPLVVSAGDVSWTLDYRESNIAAE